MKPLSPLVICLAVWFVGCSDDRGSELVSPSSSPQASSSVPVVPSTTIQRSRPGVDSSTAPTEAPIPTQEAVPTTTQESVPTSQTDERVWPENPRFESSPAPSWPFHGSVQLWPGTRVQEDGSAMRVWSLRYWSWDTASETYPQVELPGLSIECLGQIALVVHGEHGIEIGGAPGAASATYWIPWGDEARESDAPSPELLTSAGTGPSNVPVTVEGDWVHVGAGLDRGSYAMRDPARPDGVRWNARARHEGAVFLLTVHPAHLPCYSGVTWLSLADTGEFVACGANTAATAFVAPAPPEGDLVLPDPEETGTYLSCAPVLNLARLPFTETPTE